ncbi:phosphatase PAP2 family protein [Candidatus Gracilibacteria bacterium]|nr:phosphatase PAP2 family protein [Candidatus Gracilibacteria bacterium]
MQEINKELLIYLNSLMENNIIEKIALIFSDTPIFFIPIFLVFMWFYYTYKKNDNEKKKDLLFIFYSAIIVIIINYIIKAFVDIDRPETVLEGVGKLLLDHIPDASFPSDHAGVGIAFLTSLFLAGYKKIGLLFLIPAIIMLISRVIVGVHWPFDIIAGTITGLTAAFISFKLLKKCKKIDSVNYFIIKVMNFLKM